MIQSMIQLRIRIKSATALSTLTSKLIWYAYLYFTSFSQSLDFFSHSKLVGMVFETNTISEQNSKSYYNVKKLKGNCTT